MANNEGKEKLFQIAYNKATLNWGNLAWDKLSEHMRRAIVTEQCFLLLSALDEATNPESVVAALDYFHGRIIDTFPNV